MTREEAIKELRGFIGQLTEGCQEAIKVLIPELAESEDERTRKEIVGFIRSQIEDGNSVGWDRWIAYLEKQKEHQNNSDAPEKALGRDLTFPQDKDKNLDEIAQDYVDSVKEYNPEPTWDLMQTAVCYGYHYREQEEQNPAQLPTWRKASNHYEEPCIGSAFEKTGRRYTALYMGGFYIDLDELYNKLPKAAYKEGEE